MSNTIRVIDIVHDTTVDGPGFRTSIYCAGCEHHCPGCHNPQSWSKCAGSDRSVDELMDDITSDPFAHVTFSGGDPFFQAEAFTTLARRIKEETDKTIWCYTGFTYEQLQNKAECKALLQYIDVLVDGPFIQEKRDENLLFRGSSNQRLIDLHKTAANGNITLWERAY